MFEYLGKKVRCPRKLKKRLKKKYPFGISYLYHFLGVQTPSYQIAELRTAFYLSDMLERICNFGPTIDFK